MMDYWGLYLYGVILSVLSMIAVFFLRFLTSLIFIQRTYHKNLKKAGYQYSYLAGTVDHIDKHTITTNLISFLWMASLSYITLLLNVWDILVFSIFTLLHKEPEIIKQIRLPMKYNKALSREEAWSRLYMISVLKRGVQPDHHDIYDAFSWDYPINEPHELRQERFKIALSKCLELSKQYNIPLNIQTDENQNAS